MNPCISFVVPTYNRAHTVARTLETLQNQPLALEIIVVDDASTDNLAEVLQPFIHDPRFRVIRFPENKGQNFARNEGIRQANGIIVTIMDSDDQDAGTDLSEVVKAFDNDPELIGVFTASRSITTGELICLIKDHPQKLSYENFADGTYQGEYQLFLKKSLLPKEVFAENLGIKRSCTMLTLFSLARTYSFLILPLVTRLYDDGGVDRMGNINNIIRDAHEIGTCYEYICHQEKDKLSEVAPCYWAILNLNIAYYILLSKGRKQAWQAFRSVHFLSAPKRYIFVLILILLGSSLSRWLRKRWS